MKLLVDVGNSRVKWAWLADGQLHAEGTAPHHGQPDVTRTLGAAGRRPNEILLASVAGPALTEAITQRLTTLWPVPLRRAQTAASGGGVRNGYHDPAQMGVDRWLAMVAAYARYHTALCVVDAGTALTVDLVGADGVHAGGLILPGRALMRSALLQDTGGIATATDRGAGGVADSSGLGRDTDSCIRYAALRASAGLVESAMKSWPCNGVAAGMLVITGGDAPAVMAALVLPAEHRPLLVLEGLAILYGGAGTVPP